MRLSPGQLFTGPFNKASSPTRAAAISLYAEVIEGARIRVPAALRSRLARLPVLRSMTRRLLAVLDEVLG